MHSELVVSNGRSNRFHLVCVSLGLMTLLISFVWVPLDDLSLVNSTLSSLKFISIITFLANAVGYFILTNSTRSKHKQFSAVTMVLALVVSVLSTYIVIILFGAPLLSKVAETFHFAILLAVLCVVPFVVSAQRDWDIWLKIIFMLRPKMNSFEWSLLICTAAPLAGCAVGSIFIPLDWDRPWQKWPVTCCVGALTGFTLGHLICFLRSFSVISQKITKRK